MSGRFCGGRLLLIGLASLGSAIPLTVGISPGVAQTSIGSPGYKFSPSLIKANPSSQNSQEAGRQGQKKTNSNTKKLKKKLKKKLDKAKQRAKKKAIKLKKKVNNNQKGTNPLKRPPGFLRSPIPGRQFAKPTEKPSSQRPGSSQQKPIIKYPLAPLGAPGSNVKRDKDVPSRVQESGKKRVKKRRRRKYLPLGKPMLVCRSFKNRRTNQRVRGFRARLYGKNHTSVASTLKSSLNAYQAAGGSLSRCIYSANLSPSLFTRYFKGRPPTYLIRSSDSYKLPVYTSFREFRRSSGRNSSKFGLIGTTRSIKTSKGSRKYLRLTINNALILFVDGRNQSLFRSQPRNIPLRLVGVSSPVRQVLADSSKSSLQRLIDFKKLKRIKPSSQNSYLRRGLQSGELLLSSKSSLSGLLSAPMSAFQLQSENLDYNPLKVYGIQSEKFFVSQVDASNYCQVRSSLFGAICADIQSSAITDAAGCETVFSGRSSELMVCQALFAEIDQIQGTGPVDGDQPLPEEDPSQSDLEESSSEEEVNDMAAESDDFGAETDDAEFSDDDYGEISEENYDEIPPDEGLDESTGSDIADTQEDFASDDSFDDADAMLPEGMGAPTGPSCTGKTFGEQFACALLNALSAMLQQAFTK